MALFRDTCRNILYAYGTPVLWLLRKRFGATQLPGHIAPVLDGSGKGFFFGIRNKKDFFLSLMTSLRPEQQIFDDAKEILSSNKHDDYFRHCPLVGKAYWLRRRPEYSESFIQHVTAWIDTNPLGPAAQESKSGTAAIRAINWLVGYHFFADAPELTNEFRDKFFRSLFIHGNFTQHHCGIRGRPQVHRFADAVGLIFIGTCFRDHPKGSRWFEMGIRIFERELLTQTIENEDLGYVLELSILAYQLAYLQRRQLSTTTGRRLHKLFHLLIPEIHILQSVVDRRILCFSEIEDSKRYTELLPIGSVLFDDASLKKAASDYSEYALFILGTEGYERFRHIKII